MPSPVVVLTANLLQASIPFFSLAAYIPQWLKLRRLQSSTNLSLLSWLTWTLTSLFALFYALVRHAETGNAWALVFSTSMNLCFVVTTVLLILHYRSGPAGSVHRVNQSRALYSPKKLG